MLVLIAACALFGLAVATIVYTITSRGSASTATAVLGGGPSLPPPPSAAKTAPVADPNLPQSSNLHEVLLQRSRSERVVKPWLNKLNSVVTGATPKRRVETLFEMAETAGLHRTWTRQRIATARTISTAVGVVMGLAAWQAVQGWIGVVFGLIVFGIGMRGFDVYLTNRARNRQETITRELPDIADQIAISVQAGLSFEQAIRRTVESTEGPLSEELGRFLHDVRVGVVRQQAFRNLQERVDVPDVTSFVRAIAQAEKTGVSIAEILQIQADELREKRKQRAEERAMKLPVLMLLPLVTCILPPLLIVLLGPAVIRILTDGGFS